MKKKKVTIPLYERSLIIIVVDDIHEGLVATGISAFEDEEDTLEATVVEDDKGVIHLIIKPDASINTICHEALHVAVGVLTDCGMKMCDNSEEAYAYLIGWVAEQIEKSIKAYGKI